MKFATKPIRHCPYNIVSLGMLLHYLGKLKIQIFWRYSADMEENANKLHFKCTDFNSFMRVTVYAECIYVFLSKSCPRRWIPCWLLTKTAVTSAVTNLWCHKFDRKSKQVKEQCHEKFYLQSVWGKTCYFKHQKYLFLLLLLCGVAEYSKQFDRWHGRSGNLQHAA